MGVERLLAEGREVVFISSLAVSPTSGPTGIPSASLARHPLAGLVTFRRVGERVVVVVVPADRPIVLPPAGLECLLRRVGRDYMVASRTRRSGRPIRSGSEPRGCEVYLLPRLARENCGRGAFGHIRNRTQAHVRCALRSATPTHPAVMSALGAQVNTREVRPGGALAHGAAAPPSCLRWLGHPPPPVTGQQLRQFQLLIASTIHSVQ